ncbi:TonB-dependent receptor plug domain-containing protein [Haliscomenobacter sp.]|uniref:TonB-dependent receptor plug domain-containing protein n=1 Tax=Haliscomenobacter sp. TaxID=2717303 RepID=UPI0035942EC5
MNIITPSFFTLFCSALCLLAFGLLYERWMHRESFYQANRAYLLITPLIALLIPHLQIEINLAANPHPAVLMLEQTQQIPAEWLRLLMPPPKVWVLSWGATILLVYGAGVMISLGRSLISYLKIWQWIRSGKVHAMGDWSLVEQENVPEAASFFNYIFWQKKDPMPSMVLQHELIHVQQGHSWDVLLMECWIALYWFNPLIYRLRQRLQETHEFIADAGVIEAQGSKYAYACLLASQQQKFEQMPYNTFAAQLNTRLRRMTQAGSPQWKAVKYALCLPLVLSLALFFSVNYLQALPLPTGEITLGESIEEMEQTPVLQLAVPAVAQKITSVKLEPSNLLSLKLDTVPVQNSVKITGSATGVKIVTNGESFLVGQNGLVSSNTGKPLLIVDGKNMGKLVDGPDGNQMSKLDPGDIRSISVLKGESATAIYGDEGKDGVLVVNTKGYQGDDVQEIKLNNVNISNNVNVINKVATGTNINSNENVEIRVNNVVSDNVEKVNIDASQSPKGTIKIRGTRAHADGRPLIVKDGKVLGRLHQYESDEPLKGIDMNTIKSINVIKGKAGIDKYGQDAEDGVIEVETKKQ